MPCLPLEIVCGIVDDLALTGTGTDISSASRISPFFREACLRHLYSSISISLNPGSRIRNDELADILKLNPHIGTVARKLKISLTGVSPTDTLSGALRFLHSVTDVALFQDPQATMHWGKLSYDLRSDIIHLLVQSPLEQLSIHNLPAFPVACLNMCASLRSLDCRSLGHATSIGVDLEPLAPSALGYLESLKRLEISTYCDIIHVLKSPKSRLSLSRLRDLEFWVIRNPHALALQKVIDTAASSLEKVVLHAFSVPSDTTIINLSSLPRLRRLDIHIRLNNLLPIDLDRTYLWIIPILRSISPGNNITDLAIQLNNLGQREITLDSSHKWREIDEIIQNWDEGGEVGRRVVLEIGLRLVVPGDPSAFFRTSMPNLTAKGGLVVRYQDAAIPI